MSYETLLEELEVIRYPIVLFNLFMQRHSLQVLESIYPAELSSP